MKFGIKQDLDVDFRKVMVKVQGKFNISCNFVNYIDICRVK